MVHLIVTILKIREIEKEPKLIQVIQVVAVLVQQDAEASLNEKIKNMLEVKAEAVVIEGRIQTGARLAGVKGKAKPSGSRKALKW